MNGIGRRVKERRKALKLTQDNLCAQLAFISEGAWNPDKQEVFKIEAGLRTVTDLEVLALARSLKCSPCFLLTGEGRDRGAEGGSESAEMP